MLLSIIIPDYNAETSIRTCLESIWSQNMDETLYEVICVDDKSIDNSVQTIQDEITRHSNLSLIQNQINLHAGGARNNGIKKSHG